MATVNVKVAVRCRPMNGREKGMSSENIIDIEGPRTSIRDPNSGGKGPKTYTFDYCYGFDSEQKQLFEDIGRPIVTKSVEGYNGTLFAYGQTGSGKTWSMVRRTHERVQ